MPVARGGSMEPRPTMVAIIRTTIVPSRYFFLNMNDYFGVCPLGGLNNDYYGRTLSDASMLYFADVFFHLFYARLSWPNGWTDLHETFTRGRYSVLFVNLLDQFIPGPPETTRWAKKWRNFAYFLTPPIPFQLSRPNAAKYRNSKKSGSPWTVALHFCQFRRTLAYKPLRSRRRFTIFFNFRFLASLELLNVRSRNFYPW